MITIDTTQFSMGLKKRRKAVLDAVRPAAQAGSQELYIEAKLRAPVSDEAHYFYGKNSKKSGVRYYFKPGNLRDSIYQVYSKDNSGKAIATYHVSWNHTKAPYGFMVEYGTSRAPAHPFLRPAIETSKKRAVMAMQGEFIERVNGK